MSKKEQLAREEKERKKEREDALDIMLAERPEVSMALCFKELEERVLAVAMAKKGEVPISDMQEERSRATVDGSAVGTFCVSCIVSI